MRASYLVALAAGLTVMATGCSSVQRESGDAAPAGSPTPSDTTSVQGATASDGATASATQAPDGGGGGTSPDTGTQVRALGPSGYGALKLGMTRKQAQATGLVTGYTTGEHPTCALAYLTDAPASEGEVWFSADNHVVAIFAYGSVGTPQGVHLGTGSSTVRKTYPDWQVFGSSDDDGRGYVTVPGNTDANYQITTNKGVVVSLDLESSTQACAE